MSNRSKILLYIAIAVIFLASIGYAFRLDRFGVMQIDYMDCIYINNQLYFSSFEQSGFKRTPVESAFIDSKIGEVKFRLSENVHSSYYFNRNGDAAFLDVGTEVYSLKSDNNAIAVKIGEQYFIFSKR
jgi:hypothetical protein